MIWKTKLAEPYPTDFCDAMAGVICEHPLFRLGNDSSEEEINDRRRGNSTNTATPHAAPVVDMHNKPPADHYLTHFPFHPGCESCRLSKQQRTRCAQVKADKASSAKPLAFGDLFTADHLTFGPL